MHNDIIVLKFGSSVLRSCADFPTAVHEIYRWYRAGWKVLAVVSAVGQATERLLLEARRMADPRNEPEPYAAAELLATGERHSAALLGIALDRAGIPARVIDPREIRLTASGSVLDSEPLSVDRMRLHALLEENPVVVVPGFFGHDCNSRLHLLGRGGSDLSAVYLATQVDARRCRLLKDVDGVYEFDPQGLGGDIARRFASLGYEDALQTAAPLVQPKAVRYLQHASRRAEVAGLNLPYESIIGSGKRSLAPAHHRPPSSVLLLGLGTVGFGVYERLRAMSDRFRVVGALIRDPAKHTAQGVPRELLHTREETLCDVDAEIVVDALPGIEPSLRLTRHYLNRGASVVSANKVLIAEAGPKFAQSDKQRFLYSAAIGGSAPMIEALRREARHGEIRSIAGVLNGTCNFVLDRCSVGASIQDAVREAQARGFAEADWNEDLSGRDSERKLRVLARIAFGQELDGIAVEPLNSDTLARARDWHEQPGATLRMLASAHREEGRIVGKVRLKAMPTEHPLSRTRDEWNALQTIKSDGTSVVVSGRGAGRWPTTEAVTADLMELRHARFPT